jgi:nanoRNase/pAp phosphatase (c-di-AMP/oligoRNAs hydrolase)
MLDITKLQNITGYNPAAKKPLNHTQPNLFAGQLKNDTVNFSKPASNVIAFGSRGKESVVVSFTGLKDPQKAQKPALQMKVRGVMAHQKVEGSKFRNLSRNVEKLADSQWKDGQKLDFDFSMSKQGERINLSAPGIGPIGYVHYEIAEHIKDGLKNHPDDYRFELSNVIAGTTKGAETIGLRVNLKYVGNDPVREARAREAINNALNDPECSDKVLLYQEKTSPEEVLKAILDYENKVNGPQSKKEMEQVIDNIVKELKNPEHKNILLLGHCKPDGDTIGCVLGLKNALMLMDPERFSEENGGSIDCAIDDRMPGLFRHKMPGIDGEMKRPFSKERVQEIETQIKDLKKQEQTKSVQHQIETLQTELNELNDPSRVLEVGKNYDLVVTMDTPTPKRFTDKFKSYFDEAKKVIYIDHHPHRLQEWQEASEKTGFDMQKVHDNKLAWIADAVPAATQLVAIIGDKLIPDLVDIGKGKTTAAKVFPEKAQQEHLDAYVASLVTGASTDTGQFTRTANLLPEHIKNPQTGEAVPVQNRPNFLPEGLTKWLLDLTGGSIDKKWLREEITWELSDKKTAEMDESAYTKMLEFALGEPDSASGQKKHPGTGKFVYPELSLGIISVNYDQMDEIWQLQKNIEPDTTLLDIQNAFKYSEALGTLRSDPKLSGDNGGPGGKDGKKEESFDNRLQELRVKAKENYQGDYDSDRIAILVCQDKKEGELDEKLAFADQNGLRLSLRSVEGSIHAELLATLFGGGGHGGAAGGRVDLPGVEIDSPLAVTINGKLENDMSKVLEELKNNYEIMHKKAKGKPKQIKVVMDQSGVPINDLIANVVTEIRKDQPKEEAAKQGRRPSFTGNMLNMFLKKAS